MPEQDINHLVAQIAALAASAPRGTWKAPNGGRYGEIVTNGEPTTQGYAGYLIAESVGPHQAAYILATQPSVMLHILEVFELRGREVARLADELGQAKGKLDLARNRVAELEAAQRYGIERELQQAATIQMLRKELEAKISSLSLPCDHASWFDGPCKCQLELGHEGAHRMVPK